MQRFGKRIGFRKPLASRPEALYRQRSKLARSEQPLYSMLTRENSDLSVRARGEVAELRHVAQHEPLATVESCEHFDSRPHRAGVGVVGVIDQPSAVGGHLELQAARYCAHGTEPNRHMFE